MSGHQGARRSPPVGGGPEPRLELLLGEAILRRHFALHVPGRLVGWFSSSDYRPGQRAAASDCKVQLAGANTAPHDACVVSTRQEGRLTAEAQRPSISRSALAQLPASELPHEILEGTPGHPGRRLRLPRGLRRMAK